MALVLPQMVETTWNGKMTDWYIGKGYSKLKQGSKFMVNVLDLKEKSGVFVKAICDYCGKKYEIRYCEYMLVMKSDIPKIACKDCKGNKITINKTKYTIEIIRDAFEEKDWILLSNKYPGYTKYLYYICENGHECKITWKNFLKGRGCKKCAVKVNADNQRHSLEEVQNIFIDGGCILLSDKYNNSKQKLKYICSCGNDKAEIDLSHFKRGERCGECAIERLRLSLQKYDYWFVKKTFEENGCILLSLTYEDTEQSLDYICKCGTRSKNNFSNFLNGQRCRNCFLESIRGKNHWNWNSNLTDEDRINKRMTDNYIVWRKSVYKRDNYTCQCCGDNKGGNLNAHHKDSYDWAIEKRLNIDNGITLCDNCHSLGENSFHKLNGFGKNTIFQFENWLINNKNNIKYLQKLNLTSVFVLSEEEDKNVISI